MKNSIKFALLAGALLFGTSAFAAATGEHEHLEDHDNDGLSLNLGGNHDGICESQFDDLDDDRNIDFDFDSGDLIIEVDHEDQLIITEAHDVIYKGRQLPLSDRGRELAGRYYHTFDEVLGDITDIATDAATLGVTTASRAILAALTGGDTDEIEQDAEEKADEIKQVAEAMCDRIASVREIEAEMAREIEGFQPVIFMPADVI